MHTDSDDTQRQDAPPYWGDRLLLYYMGTAMPVGITVWIIGIAAAALALHELDLHEWRNRGEIGWRDVMPVAPRISDSVRFGALCGAGWGLLGGMYLWTAAQFWRAAERPVSAGVLAASTAGSIVLVALAVASFSSSWAERNPERVGILLACVVLSAAAFGFLTTILAQILKTRLPGNDLTAPPDRV